MIRQCEAATRMLLKVEGYRVTAVGSLAEALQHVREGNGVDLLVTDYHLSGGELGTQVIAALRDASPAPLEGCAHDRRYVHGCRGLAPRSLFTGGEQAHRCR